MSTPTLDFVPGTPRLAYEHVGRGPVVVFLHGIGGNRTNWRDQLAALADAYHAVALDDRGYGDSEDYAGPLAFEDFAADLLRVLDHLGAAQAHLVGLSMGGRIVLDFYERHPERVASLVLCDAFPGFDAATFPAAARAEFIRLRKEPLVNGKEPRDIAPTIARTLMGPNAPQSVYERLIASMGAVHKESYIKTVEATTLYERVADLTKVKVPTEVIVGDEDRLTPVAMSRRMAEAIPGARLDIIADAGHLSNIEQPAAFNAVLREFLDGL
jgi:3-oxoadipate enol-lactonase